MAADPLQSYLGCLVGLAVGDALGTTLEFRSPGTFAPVDDVTGGGPFHLNVGEWTDDTSMALCLAASLVEMGCFNPKDQMERYLRWRDQGYLASNGRCFDIGGTVSAALRAYQRSGNPYSGSTDPNSAGNGSIMRLGPAPMYYARRAARRGSFAEAVACCADSSRTTHGAPAAVDACRYFGGLLIGALNGARKNELLSEMYSPEPGCWDAKPLHPAIEAIARGSFKTRQPPQVKGSGYVVASLEAALWAFYHTDSFRDGCLRAVNLGDDADTTGAVYGQLAGAYYGYDAIPPSWREKIALREQIETFARQLLALSEQDEN